MSGLSLSLLVKEEMVFQEECVVSNQDVFVVNLFLSVELWDLEDA